MHVPAWPVLPSSTLDAAAIREKFASRSMMGVGDVCNPSDADYLPGFCDIPVTPTGDSSGTNLCSLDPLMPGCPGAATPITTTTVNGTPGIVVPSQSSANWAAFAAQMVKAGLQLAQIQAIQPGTVVSANGAILRQNPGYSVPLPSTSTTVGLQASTSTTTVLVAGLAVVAVLLMSMKGGRG